MQRALNADSVVGVVLIATGAFVVYQAFQIPVTRVAGWGPRAFPMLAALAVVLAGAVVVWSGLRGAAGAAPDPAARDPAAPDPAAPGAEGGALPSVLGLIIAASGYIWLLDKVGYLLATALATPVVFWLFGVRRPVSLIAATILCPIIYQIVFIELMRVFPPRGEWIDLIDLLRY